MFVVISLYFLLSIALAIPEPNNKPSRFESTPHPYAYTSTQLDLTTAGTFCIKNHMISPFIPVLVLGLV